MAGHSKRHNIKHRKAASDAKKSKIYSKVGKIIMMAAKGGADPSMNPSLAAALDKARYNGLPKDVIQKAIEKGAGTGDNAQVLQEVRYEAYGPGGSAMYIQCITDNTNRSAANIKSIINKTGASMATPGSVSRQFTPRGNIIISGIVNKTIVKGNEVENITPYIADDLEMDLIDLGVSAYEREDDMCIVFTTKDDFATTLSQLQKSNYKIEDAELIQDSDSKVSLSDADMTKFEKIVELLEDDDDVEQVYHNVE